MCGICGIIHSNNEPTAEGPVRRMMQAMKHRGPDDEGVLVEGPVGLGFVRLSIIDLSAAGHQPMLSADGRFAIVFNGEIFNYIELREELKTLGFVFRTQTDTEVLLSAYQAWGQAMLHKLNGMWAFVIYDRQEKKLFGARDRYGIKPFYYCMDGSRLIFASEIPPILTALGRKPQADLPSVFDFLVFNRTDQTEQTFFSEVKRLNHGHCFEWNGHGEGGFSIRKWYDLRKEIKNPFESPEEFRELFTSSVGLRLRSDVPVGVCLSGGLDSSSIVSVLLKSFGMEDINTFTAIYGKGIFGDETDFTDLFRKDLKNMYFTRPNENTLLDDIDAFVRAHAEPVPSTSPYAHFKVMELARDHVTVTLDGQGADEELAGYPYFFGFYFKELLLSARLGALGHQMYHYWREHRSMWGFKSMSFFLLPAQWRIRSMAMRKGYLDGAFFHDFQPSDDSVAGKLYGSNSLRESLINHFEYKLEHLLKWEDRNSMWFSLESRVPFLDYRLVERTLATPTEMILDRGVTKHILREAMKDILPEAIRQRKDKIGFETPQADWFRTPAFQGYIRELLSSSSFASRGIVDVKKIQDILEKHMQGKANYGNELWKCIHLENWYRQFID